MHLYWLTVGQQSIPAFDIASADMPQFNMTMKKSLMPTTLLFILVLLQSCNERPKDLIVINYKNDSTLSLFDGHVRDSSITYFPDSIFENEDNLYDIRSSMSYALYKMKEPLLYNHFLGKVTYRIFWHRSLRPAIAMRIEFDHGFASVTIKRLNRTIQYPFLPWGNPHIYNKEKSPEWNARADKKNDSLVKVLNNCNYYNIIHRGLFLTHTESDSLVNLITECNFWETNPSFKPTMQIDGDDWIIEGQNEYGYQIKLFPDLFHSSYENRNQHQYRALCSYLIKKCGIKETLL